MIIEHPFTAEEVMYIQRHLDTKPDGLVGPTTIALIRKALNSKVAPLKALVTYAQKLINLHSGVKPIKVDGYFGPMTDARMAALVGTKVETKRAARTNNKAYGSQIIKPKRPEWTKDLPRHDTAALTEYFGKPGTNLVRMTFPYPMFYGKQKVKTTMVNAKAKPHFEKLFNLIMERYTQDEIVELGLDQYSGCFNHRPVRGGKRLSTHAFAISMDIDAANNRFRTPFAQARFSAIEYQEYWNCVYEAGFKALALEAGFDAMHIQLTK